ncbi:Nagb/rpia/CoA transferase-like protein [Coniochaeta hoffmannii]|uniref:5-formyltetrahydrofolate cyclo-ligase n=1 Tax=Coniochaeta hoffmannii TaxID=91930 RepID=A0AA38SBZ0_9PEZI|nr:Nagb/rpia/CoA transferase-like protein [Coniochaeta hoffmannii]
MASLNAAKQQLRSAMKQRLGAISHDSAMSQSSTVFNMLRDFKPYVEARRVSVFLSMPTGEVQTDAIVRHAINSGKEVFVPYLHRNPLPSPDLPARVMDMVRLRDLADYQSLKPDRWGIPSIDPATVHERQRILGGPDVHHSGEALLDLILVPGVAFDISPETGAIRRLGHGKGFYDYFINRLKAKAESLGMGQSQVMLYALALSEQLLRSPDEGSVPVGPFDQRLDGLILGNGEIITPATVKEGSGVEA